VLGFNSKVADGLIEGSNGVLQTAKAKVADYQLDDRNLKDVIYLIANKRDLKPPT
jgi:hypothetical protein